MYQEKIIQMQMENPEFRMMPQNGNLLLKISKVLLRSFSNQILIFCFKNKETIR